MKKTRLFAFLILATASLFGDAANLAVTCNDGVGQYGNCAVGRATFTSTNYSGTVHINVRRHNNSAVYDDFDYDASGGTLTFTESLIPSGQYDITITSDGNNYTQSVYSGYHAD